VGRTRLRHSDKQPASVGVLGLAEQLLAVALFDDDSAEHHNHLTSEVLDRRKKVRDTQIRQIEPLLQIKQQGDDAGEIGG
jgi:hypothetical protein